MSDLSLPRRGFLRGLVSLPLIGGGVTLIGKPTAAAVPVTDALLESYDTWLQCERRWLVVERANGNRDLADAYLRTTYLYNEGARFDFESPPPSSRAAIVLSAVGVPLAGGSHG